MRTTVNLDPDIVDVARSLAATKGISLGSAISLLARRGFEHGGGKSRAFSSQPGDLPTFTVSESTPSFGTEDVLDALDQD